MLGISIYPDKASKAEIIDYIKLASKYGFGRIFTCLLSVEGDQAQIVEDFTEIIGFANSKNMEVYLDVAPHVFTELGIKHGDLSFFASLGASGIRLDQSFNGSTEASMSYNEFGLNVEINMSMDVSLIDTILDFKPKPGKIIGCHNFYPQRYTGLSFDHFVSCSKRYKEKQVRSAAFVTSHSAKIGPWPVMDGLCTLEMHRDMDLVTQVKHHYAMGLVDDIIIGNMFATEEELAAVSSLEPGRPELSIELTNISSVEDKIIFDHEHMVRGDVNDYMIRSTMPRVTHKAEANPPHDTASVLKRGTVIVGNDDFGQYKNELQIITKEISDDKLTRNVVGYIKEDELFMLDLLEPWQQFKFKKIN